MSYVNPACGLPRNSMDPVTACEAARARDTVQGIEQAVATARTAAAQTAGPGSFASLGIPVVVDVARSQNARAAADMSAVASRVKSSARQEMLAAPTVVPLNASPAEYNGCCGPGSPDDMAGSPVATYGAPTAAQTTVVVAPPLLPGPYKPAPVAVTNLVIDDPPAPKYKNLCFAIRNGAVDISQFDPKEFMALQYRCAQLGYAGACPPPPQTELYLDYHRRQGNTFPHIPVSQSYLDSLPQAPNFNSVPCADSYKMAGLSGYRKRRGLGAAWGNAGSIPCGPSWPAGNAPAASGGSRLGLFWLCVAALGAAGLASARGR